MTDFPVAHAAHPIHHALVDVDCSVTSADGGEDVAALLLANTDRLSGGLVHVTGGAKRAEVEVAGRWMVEGNRRKKVNIGKS